MENNQNKDFVYAPRTVIGAMSTVFFVGTKDYIYTYPLEDERHEHGWSGNRAIVTNKYFIKGEKAGDFLSNFVSKADTNSQKIHELFKSFEPSELLLIIDLKKAKKVKFQFNWLFGMIHVDNHIFTNFGKSKPVVKAFYKN